MRIPFDAKILTDAAPTLVITTEHSSAERRHELRSRGIGVRVVAAEPPWGVNLAATLALLRDTGLRSLLVEGGAAVITSFLRHRLVDRVVVGIAPRILGAGTEAVGDLSVARVGDGLRLTTRSMHAVGEDFVLAGDVV